MDFNNFTNFDHLPDLPRTPLRERLGPPPGPPGPSKMCWDTILCLRNYDQTVPASLFAADRGDEGGSCQNVNGMEVAHPAGTEPEFVNDVDGMRVAH